MPRGSPTTRFVVTGGPPLKRRRMLPKLCAADWEKHKEMILELAIKENLSKPLVEIQKALKQEGVDARPEQIKHKLREWGARLSRASRLYIRHRRSQRRHKKSAFRTKKGGHKIADSVIDSALERNLENDFKPPVSYQSPDVEVVVYTPSECALSPTNAILCMASRSVSPGDFVALQGPSGEESGSSLGHEATSSMVLDAQVRRLDSVIPLKDHHTPTQLLQYFDWKTLPSKLRIANSPLVGIGMLTNLELEILDGFKIIRLLSSAFKWEYYFPGILEQILRRLRIDKTQVLIKHIVYMASNNMLNADQMDNLIRWTIKRNTYTVLESLVSISSPTIIEFGVPLLESVSRVGNCQLVKNLLNSKTITDLCKQYPRILFAPLQLAVENSDMPLIYTILRAADSPSSQTIPCQPYLKERSEEQQCRILCLAVRTGNIKIIQCLLEAGANPNAQEPKHCDTASALHCAVEENNLEVVRLLLTWGADVNAPGMNSSSTPFSWAVIKNYINIVQAFLANGAFVDGKPNDFDDNTPLQIAVAFGHVELVKLLLAANAEVDAKRGKKRTTALQYASERGDMTIIRILLEAGAEVNIQGDRSNDLCYETALCRAAKYSHLEAMSLLLASGADPNTALEMVANSGKFEALRLLLNAGVSTRDLAVRVEATPAYRKWRNQTALMRKFNEIHWNAMIECLLFKAGARQLRNNEGNLWTLYYACKKGNRETTRNLFQTGADIKSIFCQRRGKLGNSLRGAVKSGNVELVQLLLESGEGTNSHSWDKPSPLEVVVRRRIIELVRLLLKAGARPDEYAHSLAAVSKGAPTFLQLSVDADADFNRPYKFHKHTLLLRLGVGETPLQWAARNGDTDKVRILLDSGANANAAPTDENGRTALQAAIQNGHLEIVQLLLKAGADLDNPTSSIGVGTALEMAVRQENLPMLRILIAAGAKVGTTHNSKRTPLRQSGGCSHGERIASLEGLLRLAAAQSNVLIIQELLNAGADDINAPALSPYGRTALQRAAECGIFDIVKLLQRHEAEVNAPAACVGGITALQGAAIGGHIDIAHLLLVAGAEVYAPPAKNEGRTAIEGAAEHGRLHMVHLLLRAGASQNDTGKHDAEYLSAANYAEKENHLGIAMLLRSLVGSPLSQFYAFEQPEEMGQINSDNITTFEP